MKLALSLLFVASIACALFAAAPDDEVIPHRQDEPPNQPLSPQEALERMTVPDGFQVELVASEPDLVNPVAMTFDDRGRIWVTESVEYPRKPAGRGRDRVKILEDTDSDGRADKVAIFADGLNIPTGVAVGYGGVWVLNAPDLLFLREENGKEVSREVVITGFGRTDTHELPNSLTWGPDGWLYGLNGVFNQCSIQSSNGKRYDFNCALWRVHPRTHEFQIVAEGTSNPYGLGWDTEGSAIIEACHWANDHLFHFVETGHYQRQAGAFPAFAMPLGSITDHSHQKTAYCGLAVLDTDAFPEQYRERICIGNIHGGCLNIDRLQRDGSTYFAHEEPDLLTANDAWFMPVSMKIGPDGCLYVLDWYDRYHCSQDAARDPQGVDRLKGRLYRLRFSDAPRAPQLNLSTESDDQLIARLASGNIFFRESAQRILTERLSGAQATSPAGDNSVQMREALRRKLENATSASNRKARLHALWVLIGSGSLEPSFHEQLLSHDDATFRAWAVRAAGNFGKVSEAIRERVTTLARDPSRDVQLQVAIAARKIEGCDALPVLSDVLAHCGNDKVIPAIAWQNLHPLLETESGRLLNLLRISIPLSPAPHPGEGPGRGVSSPLAVATLMPRFVERILNARQPNAAAVAALLEYAAEHTNDRAPECIAAISANLAGLNDAQRDKLKQQLRPVIEKLVSDPRSAGYRLSVQLLAGRLGLADIDVAEVRQKFLSDAEPESIRLEALQALIAFRDRRLLDELPAALSSARPEFAARILAALGHVENPKLADVILAEYPRLDAEVQPLAIDLIMQREPWARKLLDAVLQEKLPKAVLDANHLRKILESNDREALWAVEKAFGKLRDERNPEREKVVAQMSEFLRANLGDPHAGQQVFKNLCGQCHTIYGQGGRVGPDITSNGRASFDQLLVSVFDPSLVIGNDYQVFTVVTKDGRNLTGLIVENNDQRIVIRMAGASEETIPRNNVEYTRLSRLSMMPEGVEAIFSQKDLADLFAFLSLDKPPSDPTAKLIPGAPSAAASPSPATEKRIKLESEERRLSIRARIPGQNLWVDLVTFVMDPTSRPYLHPVRDASGSVVLTEDRPADHVWQHGIFTGFHAVNGFNYWKEDEGKQRFVRLLDLQEKADSVTWRALVELVAPDGTVVLEEEDAITVHAPESGDAYTIDFDLLLRAKERDVNVGKFFVGGLAVRMPWDKANPQHTHLNSTGRRGSDCEQQRAEWCNVERPFGNEVFGIAVFDSSTNSQHPPGWRVDEQGLINPNVSALGDWTIRAKQERLFRYRLVIYRGTASREQLTSRFAAFTRQHAGHRDPIGH